MRLAGCGSMMNRQRGHSVSGPAGWAGFPGNLDPEPALDSPHNRRVLWEGCEAAVGAFPV